MGMTGAQMLQELRDILNEPVAGFWTDAQLYRYLSRAGRQLGNKYAKRNTYSFMTFGTVPYTAAAQYVRSTVGSAYAVKVVRLEDITDDDPGEKLIPAQTFDEIRDLQAYDGTPTHYFWIQQTDGTALYMDIYLGPKPSGGRTLRLYYVPDFDTWTVDASTTDSLVYATMESVIILKAAIMAARQDQNENLVRLLQGDYNDAEREWLSWLNEQMDTDQVVCDYDEY